MQFKKILLLLCVSISCCSAQTNITQWARSKRTLENQRTQNAQAIKKAATAQSPLKTLYNIQDKQIQQDHTLNWTRPGNVDNKSLWNALILHFKKKIMATLSSSQRQQLGKNSTLTHQVAQQAAAYAMPYYMMMAQKEAHNKSFQIV